MVEGFADINTDRWGQTLNDLTERSMWGPASISAETQQSNEYKEFRKALREVRRTGRKFGEDAGDFQAYDHAYTQDGITSAISPLLREYGSVNSRRMTQSDIDETIGKMNRRLDGIRRLVDDHEKFAVSMWDFLTAFIALVDWQIDNREVYHEDEAKDVRDGLKEMRTLWERTYNIPFKAEREMAEAQARKQEALFGAKAVEEARAQEDWNRQAKEEARRIDEHVEKVADHYGAVKHSEDADIEIEARSTDRDSEWEQEEFMVPMEDILEGEQEVINYLKGDVEEFNDFIEGREWQISRRGEMDIARYQREARDREERRQR